MLVGMVGSKHDIDWKVSRQNLPPRDVLLLDEPTNDLDVEDALRARTRQKLLVGWAPDQPAACLNCS